MSRASNVVPMTVCGGEISLTVILAVEKTKGPETAGTLTVASATGTQLDELDEGKLFLC